MVATLIANTPGSGASGVTFSSTDMTIPAIAGYVPQMGDFICVFGNLNSQSATLESNPWVYAGNTIASDTNRAFVILHAITEAEVLAGTNAWTVTGLFTGAAGRGIAAVVRGSSGPDQLSIAATTSAGMSSQPTTVIPSFNGGLILAYVAPDNVGAAVGEPGAGWVTVAKSTNTAGVTSQSLIRKTDLSVAGVSVDVSNAVLSFGSSDESVSAMLVMKTALSASSGIFACL